MASKVKDSLDIIIKIKELLKATEASGSGDNEVLEIAIKELRRRYDKICHDYDTTRLKTLTLFGGSLAFLSFLYSGKTRSGHADIFFPKNPDERIFYFIGLGLLVGAVCVLYWAIRPGDWALPLSAKKLAKLDGSHDDTYKFLMRIKDEYLDATAFCMDQLAKKVTLLTVSINMLFVGAIILLVLKYFGG